MRKYLTMFVLIAVLVLSACRPSGGSTPTASEPQATGELQTTEAVQAPVQVTEQQQATEAAQPQAQSTKPDSYPAPPTYIASTPRTYPAPGGGQDTPTPTVHVAPTPGSDTGVVVGKLINAEDGQPMVFQSVYLGKKSFLTPGPGYTYILQEQSSPHSVTTPDGEFAIGNAPPGQYILVIFTPFGVSVVMQPNSDREVDVVVSAGKTVDLGEMQALQPELR